LHKAELEAQVAREWEAKLETSLASSPPITILVAREREAKLETSLAASPPLAILVAREREAKLEPSLAPSPFSRAPQGRPTGVNRA
jgi:hypothetical protein